MLCSFIFFFQEAITAEGQIEPPHHGPAIATGGSQPVWYEHVSLKSALVLWTFLCVIVMSSETFNWIQGATGV